MNSFRGKLLGSPVGYSRLVGELVFIGLGLHDEKGISLRGLEAVREADSVFVESYTSAFSGPRWKALEGLIGKPLRKLTRSEVEQGKILLDAARTQTVAFLVIGDPMAATTHVDLRLRANKEGISTRIVPGVSILTAAIGALGLQVSKFGRTTTIPFSTPTFSPTSPIELIIENRKRGLHSLILLDLTDEGAFLDPKAALELILKAEPDSQSDLTLATLACVVSRAGGPEVRTTAARIQDLLALDLGPPPWCLVIPGPLHFLEKEALIAFAGAPHDL